MKLKCNINVRRIGNEDILISNNGGNLEYTRVVILNRSAAHLLRETEKCSFSATLWAELLVNKYHISYEQALTDAETLISNLQALDLIVENT